MLGGNIFKVGYYLFKYFMLVFQIFNRYGNIKNLNQPALFCIVD